MPVTLHADDLIETLERAYVLATAKQDLPGKWIKRSEQLGQSPSVAFIAAVGSVLLAKATNPAVDVFVIQAREGSAGAFNLRAAASALAAKKRAFGYDIGSSSDRDPINHGTLVGSKRWDVALERIRDDHKPFFQLILTWLVDVNKMTEDEATEALAAYLRVRRSVVRGAALEHIPPLLSDAPTLPDLANLLGAFTGADAEGGARGMALVAATYRAAGFDASLPSRNDPRRIDIPIRRRDAMFIGAEVKQIATNESTADTLAAEAASADVTRALLAVLPPGGLVDFDRASAVRRAERDHGVVLRITHGARELIHEALVAGDVTLNEFCSALPRLFGEALRDIRASDQTLETWAAIASRWR